MEEPSSNEKNDKERFIRYLEDREDAMAAEILQLKNENRQLCQSRDRQLCANRRIMRSKEKLRLRWKAGKVEITRLKAGANEKDILITQLRQNELPARLEASRLFENLQNGTTELKSVKKEARDVPLSRDEDLPNLKRHLDWQADEWSSLTDAKDCKIAKLKHCLATQDQESVMALESANLMNSLTEAKAQLVAVEALNKTLQEELNAVNAKLAKSQKAVNTQILLMSGLRQQLKSAQEERENERQKNYMLKSDQSDLKICQSLLNSKTAEATSIQIRLERFEKQLNRERETQKELTRRAVEALQNSLDRKTNECRNLQNGIAALKNEVQMVQESLKKKSDELTDSASQFASAQEEITHLREVNSTSHTTILEQEKVIDNLTKQMVSLQKAVGETNFMATGNCKIFSDLKNDMDRIFTDNRAKIKELEAALDQKTSECHTAQRLLSSATNSLAAAASEAESFDEQYRSEVEKRAATEELLREKSTALLAVEEILKKKSDELAKSTTQITFAQKEIVHLREVNSTVYVTVQQQKQVIDELTKQGQSLQTSIIEMKTAFQNEADCNLKQLHARDRELLSEQKISQLKSRDIAELRQMVGAITFKLDAETKRNQSLENHLVQRELIFATEVKNERTNQFKLRAEFASQTHFTSNLQAAPHDIRNRQVTIESLRAELKPRQNQSKKDFIRAQAELLKLLEGKESELARYKHEIICNQSTIGFHQKTIIKLEGEKAASQGRLNQLEQSVYSLASEATCKAQAISDLEQRNASMAQEISSKDRNTSDLLQKVSSLSMETRVKEQSIRLFEKKIAALTSEINMKQQKFSEAEQKIATLSSETSRNRQTIAELEQRITALGQEGTSRDGQIIEIEATLINEQAKREKLQELMARGEEEMQRLIEQKNTDKISIGNLRLELEERDKQITQLQYEIGLLKNAISNLNAVFASFQPSSKET